METTQKLFQQIRRETEKVKLRLQEQEQRYKELQEACEKEKNEILKTNQTLEKLAAEEQLIAFLENSRIKSAAEIVPMCSLSFLKLGFPELIKILSQEKNAELCACLEGSRLSQENMLSMIERDIARSYNYSQSREKWKKHPFEDTRQLMINKLEKIKEALKALSV